MSTTMEAGGEEATNSRGNCGVDSAVSEEIGHFLSSTLPIVSNTLVYLNAKDLNRSASVCKFWSDVVRRLKARRRTKAWTCLITDESTTGKSSSPIIDDTLKFFNNLYTEPKVIFLFCCSEFVETLTKVTVPVSEGSRREKKKKFTSYADFVSWLVPADCKLIRVSTAGIVGTSSDLKQIYECESDYGVSLLCLPDFDGVSVIENVLDEQEDASDIHDDSRLIERMPDVGTCKAVLNFVAEPNVPRSFVHDLKKDFVNAVLAGGMVDTLMPSDLEEGFPVAMQLALCGEKVDVGCVVIRETVYTKEKAEEKMKQLKNYKLSEENSFAFMFACVGRGAGLWGEGNVESALFKKHFPNTPLFGFFGNGEIGTDHISTEQEQGKGDSTEPFSKKSKRNHKLFHSYTTIMVLVSIR